VDGSGNVYVADTENNRIRKITASGVVTTLAGSGNYTFADGNGTAASFRFPQGVAVDGSGNVYVADTENRRIRKITPSGSVTTLAGSGDSRDVDGEGTAASFWGPQGVAVDGSGNVFVSVPINVRKITPSGKVTTLAGSFDDSGFKDGPGTTALFNEPMGLAVDGSGNVYVADTYNHRIRKITISE
jgi:sugar lactone lactonase YvrE